MGKTYVDLNYVDYKNAAYLADAKAKKLTIPVDYYYQYIPQKTGATWNYKDLICQNNYTMCMSTYIGGGGSGGIVGAIIGVLCCFCCTAIVFWVVCKPKAPQTVEIEVMVQEGKEVEVMIDGGM